MDTDDADSIVTRSGSRPSLKRRLTSSTYFRVYILGAIWVWQLAMLFVKILYIGTSWGQGIWPSISALQKFINLLPLMTLLTTLVLEIAVNWLLGLRGRSFLLLTVIIWNIVKALAWSALIVINRMQNPQAVLHPNTWSVLYATFLLLSFTCGFAFALLLYFSGHKRKRLSILLEPISLRRTSRDNDYWDDTDSEKSPNGSFKD